MMWLERRGRAAVILMALVLAYVLARWLVG